MKLLFRVLLLCLSAAHFVHAQNAAAADGKSEALKYLNIRPEIKVSVHQSDQLLSSPLKIYVLITNLADMKMTITSAEIDFPEMAIGREAKGPAAPLFTKKIELNPGNTTILRMEFPAAKSSWYFPIADFRMLFFKPGEYESRVIVTYKYSDRAETMSEEKVAVKLGPPMYAIIWGSVLGSLLLSLFIAVYNLMKTNFPRRKIFVRFVYVSVNGIISGIILVLLISRMKNLGLPIEITVADFIGGVVLGLFTFKLGDWIYEKLVDNKKLMYGAPKEANHPNRDKQT